MLEVQFCSPWNVDIKSRLPIENPSSRSWAIPLQSLKSYPLSNLSWKMAWNGDGWTRDWAQPSPHFPRVKTLEEPPRRHQNYSKSSKNASLLGWTRGFGDGWTQMPHHLGPTFAISPEGEASSGEASKIEKNHKSSKNVGHLRDLATVGPECLTTWVQPSPFLPERWGIL